MVSPEWSDVLDKYFYKDLVDGQKDFSQYFERTKTGKDGPGKRQLHNRVSDVLLAKQRKRLAQRPLTKAGRKAKRSDIHSYSAVKNSDKMYDKFTEKLIADKKVVKYNITKKDGTIKEIIRNNIRWSKDDLAKLKIDYTEGKSDKIIARELGRTKQSVRRQRQKQGIGTAATSSLPKSKRNIEP